MFNEKNKTILFDFEPENKDMFKSTKEVYSELENMDTDNLPDFIKIDTESNQDSNFILPVHGYFFFETVHGASGALLLDKYNMYIPKHMLDIFRSMSYDEIKAIEEGHLGISLYLYDSKQRKECVGIKLHDI